MTWFAICLILAALGLAYVYYAGHRQRRYAVVPKPEPVDLDLSEKLTPEELLHIKETTGYEITWSVEKGRWVAYERKGDK